MFQQAVNPKMRQMVLNYHKKCTKSGTQSRYGMYVLIGASMPHTLISREKIHTAQCLLACVLLLRNKSTSKTVCDKPVTGSISPNLQSH